MFFDTDIGGVVHNIAYLRMIETARTRLAAVMGLALRGPATLGDEIIIRGRLESVERVRFWCAFEMIRAADELLLVTCRQALAMVQMPQGRPMRLPNEWFDKYEHLVLKKGRETQQAK